jgi:3-dehydroquinate dehydratase type I
MRNCGRTSDSPARKTARVRTRICTSLRGRTSSELASKAREAFSQGTDLVEFRIDLLRPRVFEDIKADLSEFFSRSVVTVRPVAEGGGFEGDESTKLALLRKLGGLQPAFLDLELRSAEAKPGLALSEFGRNIIVSWHDPVKTGSRSSLRSIAARSASFGGLVKIVTTARNAADNLAILSLYEDSEPPPIAFCMGVEGIYSRVMAMERGSPIAYASLPGDPTAPGQLSVGSFLAIRRRFEDV